MSDFGWGGSGWALVWLCRQSQDMSHRHTIRWVRHEERNVSRFRNFGGFSRENQRLVESEAYLICCPYSWYYSCEMSRGLVQVQECIPLRLSHMYFGPSE